MEIAEDVLELGKPTLPLGLTIYAGAWGQVLASPKHYIFTSRAKFILTQFQFFFLLLLLFSL